METQDSFEITYQDAQLNYPELLGAMDSEGWTRVVAYRFRDMGRLQPRGVKDVKPWDGIPHSDGRPDPFFTGWRWLWKSSPSWHHGGVELLEWRPPLPVRQ